jgi:heme o synthase
MPTLPDSPPIALVGGTRWRDYLELTKPKVSLLIVFTAIVGMVLASPGLVPLPALIFGTLGIALASGSAASFNHVLDRRIDEQMGRTRHRPLPTGHLQKRNAVVFATVLAFASMLILWLLVNGLTAALTFCSLIGYAMVYTMWLKRATPQNIVIGGAAGAFPPMIGWAAATGGIGIESVLMFLIIFFWTPPHFWALSLWRSQDYARAGIPMLPVVAGAPETRRQILIYSLALAPIGAAPWLFGEAGLIYGATALVAGGMMARLALKLYRFGDTDTGDRTAKKLFGFSILYLFLLFAMLLIDDRLGAPGRILW